MNKQAPYIVPPLLFWQYMVCSAVLGIVAIKFSFYASFSFCLLLLFCVLSKRKIAELFFLLLSFVLAFYYADYQKPKLSALSQNVYNEQYDPMQEVEIVGDVVNVQGVQDRRLRVFLENVVQVGQNEHAKNIKLHGTVILTWDNAPLFKMRPVVGQRLQLQTKVRPFYGDLGEYWNLQNAWYGAWNYGYKHTPKIFGEPEKLFLWREQIRLWFAKFLLHPKTEKTNTTKFLANPENQARAILLALLFGDKFYLTQKTMDVFNASNLLHSLALSGQHLSLVALLGLMFVFVLSKIFSHLYLFATKRFCIAVCSIALGLCYAWLGASPYSLLRALAMLILGAVLWARAKHITLLDVLFMALGLFIVFNPLAIFDLGVQLSFCSVFTIAFLLPFLRFIKDNFVRKRKTHKIAFYLFSLFCISLCIQLSIMPFIIFYFGRVSWFFVANILWLPILAFWVLPITAFAFFFSAFSFSSYFVQLAVLPTKYLIMGLDYLDSLHFYPFVQGLIPYGIALLGFYIALFCLVFGFKKNATVQTVFLCLAMLFLSIPFYIRHSSLQEALALHIIDVGQGQAILIENGKNRVLLDAGGTSSKRFNVGKDIVAKFATQNKAPYFSHIIASHDDSDHINGIAPLLQTFNVEKYFEPCIESAKESYAKKRLVKELALQNMRTQTLQASDFIDLGNDFGLEILYPTCREFSEKQEKSLALARYTANNSSLLVRLVHKGHGVALFCGDIEEDALEAIHTFYSYKELEAEILVLPHHGSDNSYSPIFYEKVNPRFVIASCGKYNRFNFPSPQIVQYFTQKNIPVLSTADEGTISFQYLENIIQPIEIVEKNKTFLQYMQSIL